MSELLTTKVLAQFTKYPFFLFLTYKKEANLDSEKMELATDLRSSRIEPVPIWQIAIMKYVPLLFLLYWSNKPNTLQELYVMLFAIVYVLGLFALWNWKEGVARIFGLVSIVAVYYILFKLKVPSYYIMWFIGFSMSFIVILYMIYDITNKRYKNYYKLLDLGGKKHIQLTTRQKRPLLMVPFMRKMTDGKKAGILHVNQGVNFGFNVFLTGYFVRIIEEIKEDTHNETV